MKILPLLSLGLGISLFATPMPSYKTSLGLEVGSASSVFSTTSDNEKKYNDIMYGISFKMEDRISETNLYYGIGFDYTKFNLNDKELSLDLDMETYNLYPVLSYNFTKNFSINTFAGLSYQISSLKDNSLDLEENENQLTFLYGLGIDYAISKNITNGIVLRKYQPYDFYDSGVDIDSTTLSYRIGLSF